LCTRRKTTTRKDTLTGASEMSGSELPQHDQPGIVLDLDRALVKLPDTT